MYQFNVIGLAVLHLSQLMHTNYFNYKTVKIFKTIIYASTCFGLHKPSSGSYRLRFAKVTLFIVIYNILQSIFNFGKAHAVAP